MRINRQNASMEVNWGAYHQKLQAKAPARAAAKPNFAKTVATNWKSIAGRNDKVETVRKDLDGKMKNLEAQDRLGNFEIQSLMSAYNQAETLSSNIQKKSSDTVNGAIGKIG